MNWIIVLLLAVIACMVWAMYRSPQTYPENCWLASVRNGKEKCEGQCTDTPLPCWPRKDWTCREA